MIDTLAYSFTKKLSTNEKLDRIVSIYKNTYNRNSIHYKIKLYTDLESVNLFDGYFNEKILIDTSDVVLLNDMKFSVLPLLPENELLIDGDILLNGKLSYGNECDIICDIFIEEIGKINCPYYTDTVSIFLENGVTDVIPSFNQKITRIPNIGILKFKSKDLEEEYLSWYRKLREWFIDNNIEQRFGVIKKDRRSVATTSQYLLSLFIKEKNKTVETLRDKNNYLHFLGEYKYTENFKFPN